MDGIIMTTSGNGTFYHQNQKDAKRKPNHVCIEEAIVNDCEVIVQVDQTERHRIFGYFKSFAEYCENYSKSNIPTYEIICRECKLCFDIEYKTDSADFLQKSRKPSKNITNYSLDMS